MGKIGIVWNNCGMDDVRVVRLPAELVERVDEAAAGEFRSRSNLVRLLVDEGLRRREPAERVEPAEAG
jgi:metal-responsive CopG/Arc/MetJ family transcriptional regulator